MASYSGWSQFQQPLPPGWEAKYDARIGRYYFIDHSTKQTSWQDPRTRQPEAIPLQNLERPPRPVGGKPQQQSTSLETRFGGSSSQGPSQVKPSTSLIREDKEEDFPLDTEFIASMLNEKSESDKQNVARKLKQEFPDVDDVVLDVALRTAKHDEDMARKLVMKLKGVDDYKNPPTQKKEEPKKKPTVQKKEEPKKKQPPKRKEEPTKAKGVTVTIGPSSKSSSAGKLSSSTEEVTGARKGASAEVKKKSTSVDPYGARETDVKLFGKTVFSGNYMTSGSHSMTDKFVSSSSRGLTVAQLTSKPGKQSTLAVKTNQQQARKVSAGRGKTFNSPLRIVPCGPNASLHQGPNHKLLLPEWVKQQGPQNQNRQGPQRSNREGPTKRTTQKVSLYCGAQSSMRQGPMPNLVMGSMYAK